MALVVLLQTSFADSGVPGGIKKARVALIASLSCLKRRESVISDREEKL